MMEDPQEMLLERAQQLHGEAEALEERIGFIGQQILELRDFEKGLGVMDNNDSEKIFAGLGKGVFVPAKIENRDLFVEVGAGVGVKVVVVVGVVTEEIGLVKGFSP